MISTRIESHYVQNLAELRLALDRMSQNALHQIPDDCVVLLDAPLTISLDCETLSDRSEVYNLVIRAAA